MTKLFLSVLNMSLSASWLVLAVLILRFLLRKAPKWVSVLLWGLVALRLICPFTLESALSLIPSAEVISPEIMTDPTPQIQTGIEAVNRIVNPVISQSFAPEPTASANPLQILIPVSANCWLLGICVMLFYTAFTYLRLHRRVRMAIRVRGNLYLSEFVSSPFVLGLLRPKIYLPYHMPETHRTHVIAHERAHIRRHDHWWKPLGFLLLSIHWFNPLMWLAYILLCRDIELACDEKVIRELGTDARADYSQALLHCAVTHRSIAACPLAFGEISVTERVKNILTYRRPAFRVICLCLILVVIVSACFLTDPRETNTGDFPISMTLYDVSRTRAHLVFHYDGTLAQLGLSPSKDYTLERQVDGTWQPLSAAPASEPVHEIASEDFDPYAAWSSLDLEAAYGRLSDGTYRIRKDITRTDASGETETRPFYAEFTVGGTADPYVTYVLEDITPTGATLNIQEKTKNTMDLIYNGNEGFWMEVYQDGQWHYLESTAYIEPIFADHPRYIHALHISSQLIELDWTNNFGQLSPGTYRIAREVTYTGSTAPHVCTAYAEFTVQPNIGIDLLLDRISDSGITLAFLLDETVDPQEYFLTGTSLQFKDRVDWEDVRPSHTVPELSLADIPSFSLLWDPEMHTLTEGQYRIGITLTHRTEGKEETHTLYEYFDPAAYAWGVTLDVTGVTVTDSELWIEYQETYTKALPAGSISIRDEFLLQKRENNQWSSIPQYRETHTEPTESYPIHMPGTDRGGRNLTALYGQLQNGTYRLCRTVTRHYSDGSTEQRLIYAVFTVDSVSTGHVSLGTATVTVTHPSEITKSLRSADFSGTASYIGTGCGYNFFDYMTEELVTILNGLETSDFLPSPGITPTTSITLERSDLTVTLLSDGETVEFDFGPVLNGTYSVKNQSLNDFFTMINSYSPENSTYEIYNVAPLEDLPQSYTLEEAAIDKVVTFVDGDILDNASVWQEFVEETAKGSPATVRTMHYYSLPDPDRYAPELYESIKGDYPKKYIHDLSFDGKTYTLRWFEEGKEITKTYLYLRHFTGEAPSATALYDRYDQYLLTNDAAATWEEIFYSAASSQLGAYIDHYTIYSDYIYLPKNPTLPTPVSIQVIQEGKTLSTLEEEKLLHEILHLLQNAEDLGFEPKTYSLGYDLIFTEANGNQTTIQLVLEEDLFKLEGTFYDYGPGYDDNGSIDNRRTLFDLLGLQDFLPEA